MNLKGTIQALGLAVAVVIIASPAIGRDNSALKKRLTYLRDIEEVAWVEFEDNDVYVGFTHRPSDLAAVINTAALHGNRAHGFGVHVWAVFANPRGWRPGDGPYYCEATARSDELKGSCD